jgi:hypothetical protein
LAIPLLLVTVTDRREPRCESATLPRSLNCSLNTQPVVAAVSHRAERRETVGFLLDPGKTHAAYDPIDAVPELGSAGAAPRAFDRGRRRMAASQQCAEQEG